MTTKLLGLHSAGVGDEEGTVVRDEQLAELERRGGVVVLGVVGNKRLGDGLSDGVDLRSVSTTGNADSDVDSAVMRRKG